MQTLPPATHIQSGAHTHSKTETQHAGGHPGGLWVAWGWGVLAGEARQLVNEVVAVEVDVKGGARLLVLQQGLDLVAPPGHARRQLCLHLSSGRGLRRAMSHHHSTDDDPVMMTQLMMTHW